MQPSDSTFQGPSKAPLFAAIIFGLLFAAAAGFGVWAYQGRQNYKNNADKLAADATTMAKSQQASVDQTKYDGLLAQPYKTFKGPDTYGSVSFSYPKNWSGYVDETSTSEPINGYFYPDVVPAATDSTTYALRVELVTDTYDSAIQDYQSLVQNGSATASVFVPVKLKDNHNVERGTKFIGALPSTSGKGEAIIIPVRNQTLAIYTQSPDYEKIFEAVVLPSLTFSP